MENENDLNNLNVDEIEPLLKSIGESVVIIGKNRENIKGLEAEVEKEAAPHRLEKLEKDLDEKREDEKDFEERTVNALIEAVTKVEKAKQRARI